MANSFDTVASDAAEAVQIIIDKVEKLDNALIGTMTNLKNLNTQIPNSPSSQNNNNQKQQQEIAKLQGQVTSLRNEILKLNQAQVNLAAQASKATTAQNGWTTATQKNAAAQTALLSAYGALARKQQEAKNTLQNLIAGQDIANEKYVKAQNAINGLERTYKKLTAAIQLSRGVINNPFSTNDQADVARVNLQRQIAARDQLKISIDKEKAALVEIAPVRQSNNNDIKKAQIKYNALTTEVSKVNDVLKQTKEVTNAAISKEMTGRMRESVDAIGKQSEAMKALNADFKKQEIESAKAARATKTLGGAYNQLVNKQKEAKIVLQDLIVTKGKDAAVTKKAQSEYDKLTKKVNQANQATVNFSKTGLGSLSRGFRNLLGAFGFTGALFMFAKFTKEAFNLTKKLDSLDFAMKTIIPNAQRLGRTKEFLAEITESFGTSIVTTTERYIKFLAAAKQSNVSMADTEKIFASVTKAAGVLGLKTDELNGIYLALEQMLSKGKVTTEELRRQLGERLPGAFGIMADAVGVTVSELDVLLRKGAILSADALPKFAVALEKAYGLENVEKVKTLQAATTRLSNSFVYLIQDFKDGSGAGEFFITIIDGLADNLKQIVSLLILATKIFVGYKAAVAIAWVQQKIFNKELILSRLAAIKAAQGTNILTTAWVKFTAVLRTNLLGIALTGLYLLYTALNRAVKPLGEYVAELQKSTLELSENARRTKDLNQELLKMAQRYDELKNKNVLNNVEQTEFNELLKKIAKNAPFTVTKIDEYGNAIEIATDKVKEFNQENTRLLKAEAKANIASSIKLLKELNDQRQELSDLENNRVISYITGIGKMIKIDGEYRNVVSSAKDGLVSTTKLTAEQLAVFERHRTAVQNNIKTTKESLNLNEDVIAGITGELNDRQKLEKQKREADEAEEKRLKRLEDEKIVLAELRKELKEYQDQLEKFGDVELLTQGQLEDFELVRKNIEDTQAAIDKLLGKQKTGSKPKKEKDYTISDAQALAVALLKIEIQKQKDISDNEDKSLEERLAANEAWYDKKMELIKLESEFEIKEAGNRKDKIAQIQAERVQEETAILNELGENRKDIQDNAFKNEVEFYKKMAEAAEMGIQEASLNLIEKLQGEKVARVEIERQVNELIAKMRKKNLEAFLNGEIKRLEALVVTGEQAKIIEAEILRLREMLLNLGSGEINTEALDEFSNRVKNFLRSFGTDVLGDAGFNTLDELLIMDKDGTTLFENMLKSAEGLEKIGVIFTSVTEVAQEALEFLNSQQEAYFQAQFARLQQERDIAIQFAGESASAREEIERQYEEKRRVIQMKQAKAQKDQAIFNIMINTAQGIVAALTSTPPNVPLSIAVGAIGLGQLAMVKSTQIPEFYKGTMNAPQGMALVDEKRPEVHTDRKGNIKSFGEQGANYRFLNQGDRIYKSREQYFNKELGNVLNANDILPFNEAMGMKSTIVNVNSDGISKDEFIRQFQGLKQAITSKDGVEININKNGVKVYEVKERARVEKLNNVLRLKRRIV